jgi:hypothetical protein
VQIAQQILTYYEFSVKEVKNVLLNVKEIHSISLAIFLYFNYKERDVHLKRQLYEKI